MSSSSEVLLTSTPLRGERARECRPARFDVDLRTSPYAGRRADPRLNDPVLAEVVDRAARQAAEEGRAAGYAAGYEEGRRVAAAEAAAEADEAERRRQAVEAGRRASAARAVAALEEAARDLLAREAVALVEVQDALARAAVDLAEMLLGAELALTSSPGTEAIARALALLPGTAEVVVRMNPADVAALGDLSLLAPERTVQIVPDDTVAVGDCLADSAGRHVDARLGPALERVREVLGG